MSDWEDACDPVPQRVPDLSPAEVARRRKRLERAKASGHLMILPKAETSDDLLIADFDEMEA